MADELARVAAALAGRYAVEREIGAGGMATVYLAEDLKHHRRVAVKVLRPDLAASLGPDRFLREIEVAAQLTHPNILPLLDSGEAQGLLYYVMPYVEGQSLRARIVRQGELPINEAVRLLRDVVDALAHAHAHGVVHRDIKPDNVLVSDRHALVTDFGVAKAISEATGRQQLTTAGVALGTPTYMAPEQAAADPHVDHRADIYAVGVLAYELVTGAPPFSGPTPQAVLVAHLTDVPEAVSRRRGSVPPPLEAVIMRCLEKRPADRWQSAGELLDALEGMTTPTAGTTPAGTVPVAGMRSNRARVVGWASGVAVLGLAVVAGVLWRGASTSGSADDIPPAARPLEERPWVMVAAFEGSGGDAELRDAARALVQAALDQSELVVTVPNDAMGAALRAAGRAETTRVDNPLARELAIRNSIAHVVQGRVDQLGSSFSMVLQVIGPEDGRVAATASGTAAAALVMRIGALVNQLAPALGGEVLGARSATPLASAMTPSFEAFKLWRDGVDLYSRGEPVAARDLLRQALRLDPDFALAWMYLGHSFWLTGPQDSADAWHREALARPDRLSPGERLNIEALLALNRNDVAGALAIYDRLDRQGRPRYHNHGLTLVNLRRWEEAAATYRKANERQLRPNPLTLRNLAVPLFRMGAFDEARQVYRQLDSLGTLGVAVRAMTLVALDGDWTRLEQLAAQLRDDAGARPAERFQGAYTSSAVKLLRGQVAMSARDFSGARAMAAEVDRPDDGAAARWSGVIRHWYVEGRAEPISDLTPDDTTPLAVATRAVRSATVGDTSTARRLAAQLRSRPEQRNGQLGEVPEFIEGVIAAQGGRWREVVDLLGPAASRGDGGDIGRLLVATPRIPRIWLVAEAYRRLGQPDSAAFHFERIAELRGSEVEVRNRAEVYPFVHRRLGQVYGELGQADRAREHWSKFLEVFTHPDPEFADMVTDAKAALAGLSRER